MMINLELYRVFYVVAKSGSLTKAKHELFISQPAVSQSIKQLENQLGGKLFIRTSKGMELTSEGKMIYEYVKQANNLISIAEKKLSQMKALEFGEVRIGASDTVAKYYLSKYIRRFREKYKDINIHITNRTTDEMITLLKAGKIDIGFINNSGNTIDSAVELTPYLELGECFVCNKEFLSTIDHKLTTKELTAKPLIMLEGKSATRKFIEDCIVARGGIVSPALEVCSVDLIVEFAKNGMGIGCVTREFIEEELAKGELFEVPTDCVLPKRSIALATIKGMPLNFAAQKFVETIKPLKR
jgi:DNA-binding transcriptional LysR family regulator